MLYPLSYGRPPDHFWPGPARIPRAPERDEIRCARLDGRDARLGI
jgi:hypothetical protein